MSKVILVVDDDPDVLDVAAKLIESFGYQPKVAANAADALRLVKIDGIDAVLTDVVMPGMNGYQLAQRVREIEPRLPVICVTGYPNVAEDDRHCDIVLQKPYRAALLKKTPNTVLSAKPAAS
jgi:CheY-like chemotaxis protein